MNSNSSSSGREGEEIACAYLREKNFEIIERNYHFHKMGEIDIIAQDGETLVFIEVKYRKSSCYGDPEEAITKNKIAKVRKLAMAYLFEKKIMAFDCRFDVIAILELISGKPEINHYLNAF